MNLLKVIDVNKNEREQQLEIIADDPYVPLSVNFTYNKYDMPMWLKLGNSSRSYFEIAVLDHRRVTYWMTLLLVPSTWIHVEKRLFSQIFPEEKGLPIIDMSLWGEPNPDNCFSEKQNFLAIESEFKVSVFLDAVSISWSDEKPDTYIQCGNSIFFGLNKGQYIININTTGLSAEQVKNFLIVAKKY